LTSPTARCATPRAGRDARHRRAAGGGPAGPAERDVCYFLAQGLRARLAKELPAERAGASVGAMKLAYRAKGLITELAEISVEAAQLIVADAQDDATEDGSTSRPPAWFMVEIARDLPRIAARRNGAA
jgi:hypothetical protein